MRIISQDTCLDLNYDNYDLLILFQAENQWRIYATTKLNFSPEATAIMGAYEDGARAQEVMSQIRLAWLSERINTDYRPSAPSNPPHNLIRNKVYYMPEK